MKKLTAIIVSILCLVVILAGCGSAPANADEPKSETPTQQESAEKTVTPEATEKPETTDAPTDAVVPDYEINRWTIKGKTEGDLQVAYLEHQFGPDRDKDVEEVYVFDSDSGIDPAECTIVDSDEANTRFLLHQHRDLYTFDLNTHELKCIVDGYVDYYYGEKKQKIHYTGLDYYEKIIEWLESDEAVSSGIMFINFFVEDFFTTPNEEFNDRFLEIQAQAKLGKDPAEFTDVEIMDNGDIYDLNGKYLANIHLPYAFKWSPNLQFSENGMEIMLNETKLEYYRYGEVVQSFELPSQRWKVIQSSITYSGDPEMLFAKNLNAEQIKAAIQDTKVLLYNLEEKTVWKIDSTGINKIIEECVDYTEYNGVLYWMNYSTTAYKLNWLESNESVEIGHGVVAASHYNDERAGFIVKPGDPLANAEADGMSLFIPE